MKKINLIQELDISRLNCTLNNIDYSSANIKLEKLRDYSLDWLRNAIK